jgi:NAD(P)-dependent dehydrogenase (short-subunit alcohol dehydrogenase family)
VSKSLVGKVAVITGGSHGIGLATAKRLVEEGAFVFITGRRQGELDRAVAELGNNAWGVQGDVANLSDLDRLFEEVSSRAGALDILVANAAVSETQPLGEITEEAVDRQFAVNAKGVIFAVQKALPFFRDGGSIVLVSSIGTFKAVPGQSVYTASKAALRSLARTWAVELKDRHIRVNVVSPGPTDTPGMAAVIVDEEVKQAIASHVPVGRLGTSTEIAHVIALLASDAAGFVNGADFQVDGGFGQI